MFEELRKLFCKHTINLEPDAQQELAWYGKRWEELIEEIEECLDEDPLGIVGKKIVDSWIGLVNECDGKNSKVKEALYSAYSNGTLPNIHFSKKLTLWLEAALSYHKKGVY